MVEIETREEVVRFPVYARSRASRTEAAGTQENAFRIRLAAPPVNGAANRELTRFLAGALGVPQSAVRIVRGQRGKRKLIEVTGVAPAEVRAVLGST